MSDYVCLGTENYQDIPDTDVDFKSPVDEFLMTTIRNNDRFLKCQSQDAFTLAQGGIVDFKVNGPFNRITLPAKLDSAVTLSTASFSACRVYVRQISSPGNLVFNIKRSVYKTIPIHKIIEIFSSNTQSIARGSSSLTTQTIVRAEAQQSTQAISFAYDGLAVDNIIQVQGTNKFRINFLPDVDTSGDEYAIGKYILIENATNTANNGLFLIENRNECNSKSLTITNASGVNEIDSPATAKANILKYELSSPAPESFAAGENAVFASHTDPSNNGTFEIFKTNVNGNNILVNKASTTAVEQATATGTIDTNRWRYSFLNSVPGAFAIGEIAVFSGHTSANNNGNFTILSTNDDSAFNITVYNTNGVAQPSSGGSVDTNRWVYALNDDPAGFFQIGDSAVMSGHTSGANNGTFTLVDVKYLGNNNVVVYNAAGVAQGTVTGTVEHLQKAITFREDQSANFEAGQSSISVVDTANASNEGEYLVVEQNRQAISNFNVIVEMPSFVEQLGDAGCVEKEVRSVFTNGQQTVSVTQNNQVFDLSANVNKNSYQDNTFIELEVDSVPTGCIDASWTLK